MQARNVFLSFVSPVCAPPRTTPPIAPSLPPSPPPSLLLQNFRELETPQWLFTGPARGRTTRCGICFSTQTFGHIPTRVGPLLPDPLSSQQYFVFFSGTVLLLPWLKPFRATAGFTCTLPCNNKGYNPRAIDRRAIGITPRPKGFEDKNADQGGGGGSEVRGATDSRR